MGLSSTHSVKTHLQQLSGHSKPSEPDQRQTIWVEAALECSVEPTFRLRQVEGLFGLPPIEASSRRFQVQVPSPKGSWQIGAIVGPSGSGKSTVAQAAYARAIARPRRWPANQCIVDGLGSRSIKEVTRVLVAVGLGCPRTWRLPYRALSQGERFRCDLARALLQRRSLVVFDEFTSNIDRVVAQLISATITRGIRKRLFTQRFVAVTCHSDILPWLEPDWVLHMPEGDLLWNVTTEDGHRHSSLSSAHQGGSPGRSVRCTQRRWVRPAIQLEVVRSRLAAWQAFAEHHYLATDLSPFCEGYLATWHDQPVGFVGVLNAVGRQKVKRISRLVVLPQFQGLGIGSKLAAAIGEHYLACGCRLLMTTSHPAMIGMMDHSPYWRVQTVRPFGTRPQSSPTRSISACSWGRAVVTAEYSPNPQ